MVEEPAVMLLRQGQARREMEESSFQNFRKLHSQHELLKSKILKF